MNISSKTDIIVKGILEKRDNLSISDLIEGKIRPRELQSLLLKAYENITSCFSVKDILKQHENSRFTQPCDLTQKELLGFDCIAYRIIPKEFESIELSPVNPLGVNKILAKINQKNILSTIRNTEVNADITIALSLECAQKRKELLQSNSKNLKEINLCTSHRSVRLQKFPENSGFTSHFKIFAICSAARDIGDEEFESKNLIKHIGFYLDLFEALNQQGYSISEVSISLSDVRITERIIELLKIDRKKLIKNNQINAFKPRFKPFEYRNIAIPENIDYIEELNRFAKEFYIEESVKFLKQIQDKAISKLKKKYPEVNFGFDLHRINGIGYYENLCFSIKAKNKEGITFSLVDGGLTNWTQRILRNRKERLFISGIGSELFCRNFKDQKNI